MVDAEDSCRQRKSEFPLKITEIETYIIKKMNINKNETKEKIIKNENEMKTV